MSFIFNTHKINHLSVDIMALSESSEFSFLMFFTSPLKSLEISYLIFIEL